MSNDNDIDEVQTFELLIGLRNNRHCERGQDRARVKITPPYKRDLHRWIVTGERNRVRTTYGAMMLSPAEASAEMARVIAPIPEDAATAATPPSSAAMRFSKTSYHRNKICLLVGGFNIRLWGFPHGSRGIPAF